MGDKMKEIWIEFKESAFVLKNNISRFIKYQIATKILLSIFLIPMFYWIASTLMKSKGYYYLTNGLLQKFLLSPQGIIMMLLGLAFGLMIILIEFGGLILISYQSISNKEESSFFNILKYCLYKMKYILSIDGLFVVFYLFIIIPLINSDFKISVFKQLKIPGFIMDVINANILYQIYLSILTVIFVIFAVKWIFTLPIILLDSGKVKHPLRESGKLIKNNFKYIFKYAIFVMFFNVIIFSLISSLLLLILPKFYFDIILPSTISIGLTLTSFIVAPFYAILFTKLYINIKGEENIEISLVVKGKISIIDKLMSNMKLCITLFVIAVIIMSVFTYSFIDKVDKMKYDVKITAHRGSSIDAPENTLSAIEAAVNNGADFVEIDVQETKDSKLILLHDKSFKRTTGIDKSPWELTLNEIKQLDAGSWFDAEYKDEKIPTLEEVIEYSKGKINLNIEIKTDKHNENLVSEVVRVIKENGIIDTCVVTSIDYEALEEVEKYESEIKTGYIMFIALGDLNKLNIDFYSIEETVVSKKFINNAHRIGREVHVWTINTIESMGNVLKLGVDNIITDNVNELKQLIEQSY
jgi:glycerophosphoryl diester phosphodiesterase